MKKYRVYGMFYASRFIGTFEANSPEEAEDMASESEENYVSLCHQCAHDIELSDHSASEFEVEEVE